MTENVGGATGGGVEADLVEDVTGAGDLEVAPRTGSNLRRVGERGMVTAEWAIAIIAAASLAGIAVWVFTKGPGKEAVIHLIINIIALVAKMAG